MLGGVFPLGRGVSRNRHRSLGIAAEALRMVCEGFYGVYGVLLPIWMAAVAWNLYRLGRGDRPADEAELSPRPIREHRSLEPRQAGM
jgi:hypothetical protein